MERFFIENMDSSFEIDIPQGETISLKPQDYEQAKEISPFFTKDETSWQYYLNSLALSAFQKWLTIKSDRITIDDSQCFIEKDQSDRQAGIIYRLRVGELTLCLIVKESIIDGKITIPKGVLDSKADFYIVMEVWEAEEVASIRGFLHYTPFQAIAQSIPLQHFQDLAVYRVPLNRFNLNTEELLVDLLFFSSLESTQIPVLEDSHSEPPISPSVNIQIWLQDIYDRETKSLGWSNPFALNPVYANAFRDATSKSFDPAIKELLDRGSMIPRQAMGSCRNINVGGIDLQILAGTWLLPSSLEESDHSQEDSEWSLLLILRMRSRVFLPKGIQLQVRDRAGDILSEPVSDGRVPYLRSYLIGDMTDELTVSIIANDETFKVGMFTNDPDRLQDSVDNLSSRFRSSHSRYALSRTCA